MARKLKSPTQSDERKWQIQDAINTLTRAAQIKKDPGLMAEVKKSINNLNGELKK